MRQGGVICACYSEKDFIDYRNQYVCDEQSVLITTLIGVYAVDELLKEYVGLQYFNF